MLLATKGRHETFWDPDLGESARDESGHETRIHNLRQSARMAGIRESSRTDPCGSGRTRLPTSMGMCRFASRRPSTPELKAAFAELAVHRRAESVEEALYAVPYEMWAPVVGQVFSVVRGVNRGAQTTRL